MVVGVCMTIKKEHKEIFCGNWRVPCLLKWLHKSMHVLKGRRTNHESESHSVVFNSLWPHGLHSPWNSPGQTTGVGSCSLLQGIFPTQGSNPGLLHCRQILYQLSYQGSPRVLEWIAYPFSRGSSQARNWTRISCIAGRFFTSWATREALHTLYTNCKFLVLMLYFGYLGLPWWLRG